MDCPNCHQKLPDFLVQAFLKREVACRLPNGQGCGQYCPSEIAKDIHRTEKEELRYHAKADEAERNT